MELSTALYQHDAAVRVIARLTRERDEARDALSKVTVTGGASAESNGDAMQVDRQGLPQDLVEKVEQVKATLSKSRKKRPVPASWATLEQIQEYTATQSSEPTYPGAKFISLNKSGDVALVGGADGLAGIFSIAENKLVEPIVVGDGAITAGVFYEAHPVFATSTGAVKVFDGNKPTAVFTKHAGACRGLALHPSGDILASVGVDKSFVIYDLAQSKAVAQIYTEFGKHLPLLITIISTNTYLRLEHCRMAPRRPPPRPRLPRSNLPLPHRHSRLRCLLLRPIHPPNHLPHLLRERHQVRRLHRQLDHCF